MSTPISSAESRAIRASESRTGTRRPVAREELLFVGLGELALVRRGGPLLVLLAEFRGGHCSPVEGEILSGVPEQREERVVRLANPAVPIRDEDAHDARVDQRLEALLTLPEAIHQLEMVGDVDRRADDARGLAGAIDVDLRERPQRADLSVELPHDAEGVFDRLPEIREADDPGDHAPAILGMDPSAEPRDGILPICRGRPMHLEERLGAGQLAGFAGRAPSCRGRRSARRDGAEPRSLRSRSSWARPFSHVADPRQDAQLARGGLVAGHGELEPTLGAVREDGPLQGARLGGDVLGGDLPLFPERDGDPGCVVGEQELGDVPAEEARARAPGG
jgi:hypothetical protein